jgi:4-amino-4-deoxy-L-arabinose transferase-like glycosyltransferase
MTGMREISNKSMKIENPIDIARGGRWNLPWATPLLITIGLLLLTFVLRLPGLTSRPLWYDEAFSILFAREGPSAMIYGTLTPVDGAAADVHPLFYYTLLWSWMRIFGEGVLAVRGLSLLINLGLLLIVITIGRRLFSPTIGYLAGLLFAVAPFQIHYGQEARMYGLMAALLILTAFMLHQALFNKTVSALVAFGLFSALAMYTHVLSIFFLASLAIILQLQNRNRKSFMWILVGASIGIVLYLPWLIRLPSQIGKVQSAYWIETPGVAALIQTIVGFLADLPLDPRFLAPILFLTGMILVLTGIELFRIRKEGDELTQAGTLVFGLAFAPGILMFLVSQIRPVYILRGLLPSGVMFLIGLAWVIKVARPLSRWTITISLLALFIIGNITHLQYQGFPYAPYDEVNREIRKVIREGDVILHTNKLSMLPAYLDDPSLPHHYLQDPPGSGSDTLALPTQEVLGLFAESDPSAAVEGAGAVYMLIFKQEFMDYQRLGYEQHPAFTDLDDSYEVSNKVTWGDLELYSWVIKDDHDDAQD